MVMNMEPVFAIERARYVPNPFALVHVASARTRQLNRGAEPRVNTNCTARAELALCEIAAGAFADEELLSLLPAGRERPVGDRLDLIDEASFIACGGGSAAEPLSYEAELN
jgi:DNA-directed RNA polymerase subunit K/omega